MLSDADTYILLKLLHASMCTADHSLEQAAMFKQAGRYDLAEDALVRAAAEIEAGFACCRLLREEVAGAIAHDPIPEGCDYYIGESRAVHTCQ